MSIHTMERFAMTPREKIIEEFYIGMIGRIIAAKNDEARKLRAELRRLGDHVEASTQEYRR